MDGRHSHPVARPLDPTGKLVFDCQKRNTPPFEWMKETKGGLVITEEDWADLESPNTKVRRFETEEALQNFIEDRQLVDTGARGH